MAPRDKSRPKAEQISNEAALRACETWTDKGIPYPLDAFPEMPPKVRAAKLHKLHDRGWIDGHWRITKLGRTVLVDLDEMEASA